MKIKINVKQGDEQGDITFTREPIEPNFYGVGQARGEKRLFSYLCRRLNAIGFDLTSLNTQKEGHMLGDEYQPIARPIKRKDKRSKVAPNVAFYSGFYALRDANKDWNEGEVSLILVMNYFEKRPDAFDTLVELVKGLKASNVVGPGNCTDIEITDIESI